MCTFPDFFPPDFEKFLKDKNICCVDRENVFRILRDGILNREAFYGTYQEHIMRKIPFKRTVDKLTYSTSCFDNMEAIKHVLDLSFRNEPNPKIAQGNIDKCCGPSTDPNDKGHIHWWIYENAQPQNYFTIIPDKNEDNVKSDKAVGK